MEKDNSGPGEHIPENKPQSPLIVVGINGSMKSLVAASLLKIQKYNLVGVTVVPEWEGGADLAPKAMRCYLSPQKVESIRQFCRQLGIPHYLVKTGASFRDEVVESWMACKVSGRPIHCQSCYDLRFQALYKKMLELGATRLATGHLAKLFNHDSRISFIRTSNDEAADESHQLATLSSEILSALLLPLSDLQINEVSKLAENFKLSDNHDLRKRCFTDESALVEYLESQVPPRFYRSGEVLNIETGEGMGVHEGVHKLNIGTPVKIDGQRTSTNFVQFDFGSSSVYVGSEKHFERKRIRLTGCKFSAETHWTGPLRGYLKQGEGSECWVYPKTFDSCVIELDSPLSVKEYENLTVMKSKGRNSKILLSGKVHYLSSDSLQEGQDDHDSDQDQDSSATDW